ncbi:YchJ family protein [Marisediminicola sp. LYQ134]|uniref:YchJ family protein n=1 Tax=unclassified Marisediminicola TaxID=2618316 RepID=UPI003983AE81
MDPIDDTRRCPCLSGFPLGECCGPIIAGAAPAPSALRLMRSRFTAYALGDARYVLESWHPSTRPPTLELDPEQSFFRLDILSTTRGGMLDTEGTVEFVAHSRRHGERIEQHENSAFAKIDGRWFYVDGV